MPGYSWYEYVVQRGKRNKLSKIRRNNIQKAYPLVRWNFENAEFRNYISGQPMFRISGIYDNKYRLVYTQGSGWNPPFLTIYNQDGNILEYCSGRLKDAEKNWKNFKILIGE